MAVTISTLDKLHRIETFYRQGFQRELIDRTLDKLLEQEEERAERATLELQQRLHAFEQQYQPQQKTSTANMKGANWAIPPTSWNGARSTTCGDPPNSTWTGCAGMYERRKWRVGWDQEGGGGGGRGSVRMQLGVQLRGWGGWWVICDSKLRK